MEVPSDLVVWKRTGQIGSGSFGKVYSAYREGDLKKTIFAIKVSTSSGESNRLLISEIDIHSRLTHPDIVRYVNSYELKECGGVSLEQVPPGKGKCVAMVLEYLEGKDLATKLKEEEPFEYRPLQKLGKNLISALVYLKEQGIIHRDIKPENIFIDSVGRYKLGDYGLAIKEETVDPNGKIGLVVGSPMYMAPEILLTTGQFSYAGDMWALGIVLFEAFQGSVPWISGTFTRLKQEVKVGEISRKGMKIEPEPFANFLEACLTQDPKSRLTPEEAIGHPFLQISKTPASLDDRLVQDIKEFGQGTRTDFYLWVANKYPDQHPLPWAEFCEKYDRLYVEISK